MCNKNQYLSSAHVLKKQEDSGTLELEIQVKACIGSEKDNPRPNLRR